MRVKDVLNNKILSLFLIKRNTGKELELKLKNYIKWNLKKGVKFTNMEDYLSKNL